MWITHNMDIEENIDIDIDIDEFVEKHQNEIVQAMTRNDIKVHDTTDILEELKRARQLLTTLIRKLEL
jgi:uncharacterized protein with ATP-grasp and redox domains